MEMNALTQQAYKEALRWYIDQGMDEALADEPVNRINPPVPDVPVFEAPMMDGKTQVRSHMMHDNQTQAPIASQESTLVFAPLGSSDAREAAVKLASQASTLKELGEVISEFDGIGLKKTATRMVMSDGNPKAHMMLIGDAPGADEDRLGAPFAGESGALLDKILACIDIARTKEDPDKAVYLSNMLNWRPPGNRSPSPGEIEASLPFIEKHIALVKPKILVLCGAVAAKALLNSDKSISRLRGGWHDYKPRTGTIPFDDCPTIPARVTYHPSYLLQTPTQKRAVWEDMLEIQEKLNTFPDK